MNKFLQIQDELLTVDIKTSSFKVFCILLKYSKNGICYPAYKEFEKYGICEKTAKNSINELEKKGLLLKQNRFVGTGKKTSNCYYIDEKYIVKKQKKIKVSQTPSWFDEEVQKKNLSDSEKQELEEMLKSFKEE